MIMVETAVIVDGVVCTIFWPLHFLIRLVHGDLKSEIKQDTRRVSVEKCRKNAANNSKCFYQKGNLYCFFLNIRFNLATFSKS